MRQTFIARHPRTPWPTPAQWADRAEPEVSHCICGDPDIRPLGGWWPASFTCCHLCAKPRREP